MKDPLAVRINGTPRRDPLISLLVDEGQRYKRERDNARRAAGFLLLVNGLLIGWRIVEVLWSGR